MLGLDEQEECMGGGIGRRPGILRAGLLGQVGWIPGVTRVKALGMKQGAPRGTLQKWLSVCLPGILRIGGV